MHAQQQPRAAAPLVLASVSALPAAPAQARFRTLADNIPQLAWMVEPDGSVPWYNRRWLEYTGLGQPQMLALGWSHVQHPDHVERVLACVREHLRSREPWEDTFPLRRADGQYRWFLCRGFPMHDGAGRILNWFATATDITAQRDSEQALREADRRKTEFIAVMAHELRNPLAPMRSAVEIMRRVGLGDARLERARDVVERQLSHMTRLVDDLLDLSRMAHGKMTLRRQSCDIGQIAVQGAQDSRAMFTSAGVRLYVQRSSHSLPVFGDPVRLAQIMGNLLSNAARFTPRGGAVLLSMERWQGHANIRVKDTGIGFEPAIGERLFDAFNQAHQDPARSSGGLGLGLSLVRELARLHGGSATAHSDGRRHGATFTVSIPLMQASQEQQPGGEPLRA